MCLRRFRPSRLLGCLSLVVLAVVVPSVSAQSGKLDCAEIKSMNDFLTLADTRGEIKAEITALEDRIAVLPEEIAESSTKQELDMRRESAKKELSILENKVNKTPQDELRESNLEAVIAANISPKEALEAELTQKQNELREKKATLKCVQDQISGMWSPEKSFKLWMSAAFALLIGMVIAGFFFLSNKDATMRQAIFSGQTGIQFLTLFSIVIAIILFGITGILGDKELSALLGGLSGYILGRYNNTGQAENGNNQNAAGGAGNLPLNPAPVNPQPLLPPPGGSSAGD